MNSWMWSFVFIRLSMWCDLSLVRYGADENQPALVLFAGPGIWPIFVMVSALACGGWRSESSARCGRSLACVTAQVRGTYPVVNIRTAKREDCQ